MPTIRIELPFHLRSLSGAGQLVTLDVSPPVTLGSVLNALEARYPMLCGTVRDHGTKRRRPFIRFFACKRDFSHYPPETALPDAVANGTEPFKIVGAIAGG